MKTAPGQIFYMIRNVEGFWLWFNKFMFKNAYIWYLIAYWIISEMIMYKSFEFHYNYITYCFQFKGQDF